MFSFNKNDDAIAKCAAIDRVQAVIQFDLQGTILAANENFLSATGYRASEILGRHHSMFVEPGYEKSPEYLSFWERLRRGEFQAAQYKRLGKGGREVWIQASYNPLLDRNGKPYKVVKFATDITAQKLKESELAGQIAAIGKAQAVIQFDLQGTILDANENFITAMGYSREEIKGRHHSMFVEPEFAKSAEYREFWKKLGAGEYQAAQYKRLGKGGREIWIQASYNPIFDASGRPFKVVKFATDITEQIALLARLRELIQANFAEIDQAVNKSSAEAGTALNAAQVTSDNVNRMASAAEELASSVAEISESMVKSRAATDSAYQMAESAEGHTRSLEEAASSMGGIVSLIQNIASQINLLALNATIESARAGEAGRGFAVVATEVKNLAAQAARATEQISSEIGGVRSISDKVVEALTTIRGAIDEMRNHVAGTATAVEQQSAVTREMSQSMQRTADEVSTMSSNIGAISAAVTQVSGAVATTREAAEVLAR